MIQHLSHIQIIMVNTTLPANIGSAARAMHTMGLSRLVVVNPKRCVDETSYAHSAGASHILDNITIADTLTDAIADSRLVFAASSRSRTMPRPVVNPTHAAKVMANFLTNHSHQFDEPFSDRPLISILFGREDRGLTNDELAMADYHIQIDANPAYPVLNVASAIQVITSFLYSEFYHTNLDNMPDKTHDCESVAKNNQDNQIIQYIRQQWDAKPITHQQQNCLNDNLIKLMVTLGLADNKELRRLPQRLSRLTSRIQLDEKEYQLLQSVLGQLNKRL